MDDGIKLRETPVLPGLCEMFITQFPNVCPAWSLECLSYVSSLTSNVMCCFSVLQHASNNIKSWISSQDMEYAAQEVQAYCTLDASVNATVPHELREHC